MTPVIARAPRATLACARCRRQKLKCDPNRPCTLCVHAGSNCEPQTVAERSRLNHKRLSQARAQKSMEDTLIISPLQRQLHVSPSSVATLSLSELQHHNAISSSSMDFARTVNGDDNIDDVGGGGLSASNAVEVPDLDSDDFTLVTMLPLVNEVMEAGVAAYFERFNWFVLLLHEPDFVRRSTHILSRTTWNHTEMCDVMLVFIVAACGLQCVFKDPTWHGHRTLQSHAVNAGGVVRSLLKEIGVHFYDIMTQSRLEAYQTVMLLEVYHVYFGSLNFARHMAGVPVRVAHGLGLHHDTVQNMDQTAYQVGIRCWNHAVVGELFGSMIYGQPSSLDPEFSRFRPLSELPGDEITIPGLTAALPIIASSRRIVSTLTFHVLKFELYEVIQSTLQQIKELNLRDAMSMQDLRAVFQAVEQADGRLKKWREKLPAVFDPNHWGQSEPWDALQVDGVNCTPEDRSCRRRLALQGITLQVLHDSAVILAHRPLLQCRISISDNPQISSMRLQRAPDSLKISTEAALRISRRSISHFKHHLALSFVFMHFFTAGVILCVPPIHLPYSPMASESKAGVLRIVSASRAMSSTNSIARHTDHVLTKLYRKTIQREMDGALRDPSTEHAIPSGTQTNDHILTDQQLRPDTGPRQDGATSMGPSRDDTAMGLTPAAPLSGNEFIFAHEATAPPIVPFLSFGFDNQEETVGYGGLLCEHLDETFGAFEQMYDLNLGGMSGNLFDNGLSGM